MRYIYIVFSVLISFFQFPLTAEVIETNEISIIQEHVTTDSLVLLNISGTLYQPSVMLANRQWRKFFANRVRERITNKEIADQLINRTKKKIVTDLPKKLIEDLTPELIANLQEKQVPVFGITQKRTTTPYEKNFALVTSDHLLSLGIDLGNSLSYCDVHEPIEEENYAFCYGIIFSENKPVGPAVLGFLKRLPAQPKKILMVDNSIKCLRNVEHNIPEGIEFYGFRYSRTNASEASFDHGIATIQFIALVTTNQILSDDEAKEIYKTLPQDCYLDLLDFYIDFCAMQ